MEQLYLDRLKAFVLDFLIVFFIFFIVNMVIDHFLFTNRVFYNGQHWLLNFSNLKPIAFIMLFRDLYQNRSIGKDFYNLEIVLPKNINMKKTLLIFRQITIMLSFYIDLVIYFVTRKRILDKLLNIDVVYSSIKTAHKTTIYKCLILILVAVIANGLIFFYVKYEKINIFSFNKVKCEAITATIEKNSDLITSVKVNAYDKMYGTKKGYIEVNAFTIKSYWKKENREALNNDLMRIKNSIAESTDTLMNNIELRLIKDYKSRVEINNYYINYDENLKPRERSFFEFFQ